jgi:hypothetical protein
MNEEMNIQHDESDQDEILIKQLQQMQHPVMSTEKSQQQVKQLRMAIPKPRTHWKWIIAAAGVSAVVGVLILASVASLLIRTQNVQAARLGNISGIVEISTDAGESWELAENNDTIAAGDSLRTYTDSSVLLTYPDGSIVEVGEDAKVNIITLEYKNNVLQAVVFQTAGETTHWVVPLSKGGEYLVRTQTGTAQVHGTVFQVSVPNPGLTRFSVTDGKVAVSNEDDEVFLTPGQVTLASDEGTVDNPAYDFSLKGILESQGADGIWVVNGVSFLVTEETSISSNPVVGDSIHVVGRILETGERVADMIKLSKIDKEILCFSGVIDSIGDTAWVVSGQNVVIDENTELDDGISVGSEVEVRFTVQDDGSWLALEISLYSDEGKPPVVVEPTVGPEVTLDSSETVEPEPIETEEPRDNGICGNEDKQQPEAVTLSERYGVPYEEIMNWFCLNNGFGEIDLAYSLSQETEVPVEEIFAMRESGMGWGQIKQEIQPKLKPTHKPTKTAKPTVEKGPKK